MCEQATTADTLFRHALLQITANPLLMLLSVTANIILAYQIDSKKMSRHP